MCVSTDTLRYYEKLGILPPAPRNIKGFRVYDNNIYKAFLLVQELKNSGMSLDAIAKYILLAKVGNSTNAERKLLLIDARKNLQKKINLLEESMRKADYQLLYYETMLLPETKVIIRSYFINEIQKEAV